MEAEAKAAELDVEINYFDEEMRKKSELMKLELQKKRDKEKAKSEVFERYEMEENPEYFDAGVCNELSTNEVKTGDEKVKTYLNSLSSTEPYVDGAPMQTIESPHTDPVVPKPIGQPKSRAMDVNAAEFVPVMTNRLSEKEAIMAVAHDVANVAKSVAEQLRISRIPPPEPPVFKGDPLRYPAWNAAFESLIERSEISDNEKLHHLQRYLSESIVEDMQNFFLLNTDTSYKEAKKFLDSRYGDQYTVSQAILNKLHNWPKLYMKNGQALRRYADYLRQCQTAMKNLKSLEVLNYESENRMLLAKLPDCLIPRWARIVSKSKTDRRFPSFKEFVRFVVEESNVACEPVTSTLYDRDRERVRDYGKRVTLSTTLRSCLFCNKQNHDLDQCKEFLLKPLRDRKDFGLKRGLCFGCLRWGHRSRDCTSKKTCGRCNMKHPTVFHEEPTESKLQRTRKTETRREDTSLKSVNGKIGTDDLINNGRAQKKCAMILPVWISHTDKPDSETLTYALLDTQSDATFVLNETCEKLEVSGPKVQLLLSTMHAEDESIECRRIRGLMVRGYDSDIKIPLPTAYTRAIMPTNRDNIPTPDCVVQWPHLSEISKELLPIQQCEVGILIGYNCPKALVPRDVIPPSCDGPYAIRTDLGWSVVGVVDPEELDHDSIGPSHSLRTYSVPDELNTGQIPKEVVISLKTSVKETVAPSQIIKILESDFVEKNDDMTSMSFDDKRFLKVMNDGVEQKADKHYEMPLPFRHPNPKLPNNRNQAAGRLQQLKSRFMRDQKFRTDYTCFMQKIIENGYAERATDTSDTVWYIPHHGVYHPRKPNKIRVVFDCSAQFRGKSLNDNLLQGPDLTNTLIGVLCRFRQEQYAIMCDIEQMFFQFQVPEKDRDFLRFLWWDKGDYTAEPIEYRMKVHLFGASSSPGCANYGLRKCADDYESEVGKEAADFLRHNFYVDDGLKSLKTVDDSVRLVHASRDLCAKAGIRLHKFVSNCSEVLETIPEEDRATPSNNLPLPDDINSVERPLGIQWCIENDSLSVRVTLHDNPLTRRGILSTVSLIYDPLGFISPVVMVGKLILQEMCRDGAKWDDPLPETLRPRWEKWRAEVIDLKDIQVERCHKPHGFGEIESVQYHHFSDASTVGYGQCSYIRLTDDCKHVHVSFLMGKSRVTPLRQVTIPRLELTAALVSVRVSDVLTRELEYENVKQTFWTDSKVTLGYINNEARRFKVFVANRVSQIRERTEPEQWRYIESENNPADCASRGLSPRDLQKSDWLKGPSFLWKQEALNDPVNSDNISLNVDDPELRKAVTLSTTAKMSTKMVSRIEHCSSWYRAKKCVALCLGLRKKLLKRLPDDISVMESISVSDMQEAEEEIIKLVQKDEFVSELKTLTLMKKDESTDCSDRHKSVECKRELRNLTGTSKLYKLDPYLDSRNLIRVGGRVRHSDIPFPMKHPVAMPKKHFVTNLIVQHFHKQVGHQGRGLTMNAIRTGGFWILGCGSLVSSLILKCVRCRRLRGGVVEQKMSDLPSDRMEESPPFTYCGCDMFGPFCIKEGRKTLKRYGCLFTCLASRAVHVEVTNSLSTDSFIRALRRFMAVRGPIRQLRCDQGTNFVGTQSDYFDSQIVKNFMLQRQCDFFTIRMNAPSASHAGGVWERQIRSIRNVLAGLLETSGEQLDDESLRTFIAEATAIVNSRPLTAETLNDVELQPLTPNNILTGKTSVVLPPPSSFQREDLYAKKQWRRVQHLANQFWYRWRREYLQNLQVRQKWSRPRRVLQVGDIVMIKDDNLSRCQWKLARVSEVVLGDDNLVRRVMVTTGNSSFERPVQKLVLLLENETVE